MRISRANREVFGVGTMVFTLFAMLLALSALFVAGQAFTRSDDAKTLALKGSGGIPVTLSEFSIDPKTVNVPQGGALTVANAGTVEHNLAVKGHDLATPMIAAGGSERLDLSSLKPGMYTIYCQVPGHQAAGMEAMLMVNSTGAAAGANSSSASSDTVANAGVNTALNDQMDVTMAKNTKAFPAKTEGLGGQPLAPKVLADGTKEFDLTAEIVQWEVSPGKKVEAWTYNGTVPGPTIQVDDGDKVRVVLDNQLPESTVLHIHGVELPNAMDGVPDITQPPIKPGESFTYDFVAHGPAVGMYHSHHHAAKQVPDGMAGAFLIGNEPLPAGVTVSQRVPMVLDDAGTIGLTLNGKSFPATAPIVAKLGDWVEIDYFNEGLQVHPMHLHGLPQLVIAKDGFPVPAPYQEDTQLIGPGERYTVLVHATLPGVWAFHCHILNHAETESGMFGMVTAFIVK